MSANRQFLVDLKQRLGFNFGNIYKKPKANCWEWRVTGIKQLIAICNEMYRKPFGFALERKFQVWQNIKKERLERYGEIF